MILKLQLDQYKGLLKVDENKFANNNILELDELKI